MKLFGKGRKVPKLKKLRKPKRGKHRKLSPDPPPYDGGYDGASSDE